MKLVAGEENRNILWSMWSWDLMGLKDQERIEVIELEYVIFWDLRVLRGAEVITIGKWWSINAENIRPRSTEEVAIL